jgi:hypothetical protein
MKRYALAFRVRPGTEAAVAELLSGYAAPRLEIDTDTRLLGTTVFMQEDLVVRVLEIEGELAKVAPHLAAQPEIRAVERELNQYLVEPVDPADPEARKNFLARRLMSTLLHRESGVVDDGGPATTRHALLYPIKPEMADIAERVLVAGGDPPLTSAAVKLRSTNVFRQRDVIVRVFEIAGELEALIEMLSQATAVLDVGQRMAAIFSGEYDFATVDGLRAFFADSLMTVVTDRRAAAAGVAP